MADLMALIKKSIPKRMFTKNDAFQVVTNDKKAPASTDISENCFIMSIVTSVLVGSGGTHCLFFFPCHGMLCKTSYISLYKIQEMKLLYGWRVIHMVNLVVS